LKYNNEKYFFRKDLKTIQQEKNEEEKEMVRSEKGVLFVFIFFAFSATCEGKLCLPGYETSKVRTANL
jgi:hypothetical protein